MSAILGTSGALEQAGVICAACSGLEAAALQPAMHMLGAASPLWMEAADGPEDPIQAQNPSRSWGDPQSHWGSGMLIS